MHDGPLFLLVFIGIALAVLAIQWLRLSDPDNKSVIQAKDIPSVVQLTPGIYRIDFLRQSGNIHSDPVILDRDSALNALLKKLNRSSITEVAIFKNNTKELHVSRMIYEAKGKAAGKKLGAVHLTWIEDEVSESNPSKNIDETVKHGEALLSHLRELDPLPKTIQSESDRNVLLEALGIANELKRTCDETEGFSIAGIEDVQADIQAIIDRESQHKSTLN
jgi:transcriptional regulator with AAA-type ATPase domain